MYHLQFYICVALTIVAVFPTSANSSNRESEKPVSTIPGPTEPTLDPHLERLLLAAEWDSLKSAIVSLDESQKNVLTCWVYLIAAKASDDMRAFDSAAGACCETTCSSAAIVDLRTRLALGDSSNSMVKYSAGLSKLWEKSPRLALEMLLQAAEDPRMCALAFEAAALARQSIGQVVVGTRRNARLTDSVQDYYHLAIERCGPSVAIITKLADHMLPYRPSDSLLSLLNVASQLDSDFYGTCFLKASCFEEIGEYDSAIGQYSQAIRLKPRTFDSYYYEYEYYNVYLSRAQALSKAGQHELAIQDFDTAHATGNLMALEMRARENERAKDYDAALLDYQAAISQRPMSWMLYAWRANLQERLGDTTGAIETLKSYLSVADTSLPAAINEARERLKALQGPQFRD